MGGASQWISWRPPPSGRKKRSPGTAITEMAADCHLASLEQPAVRLPTRRRGILFLLTTFLGVCIWSASAPRRRRSSRSLTSSVDTWSSCRLSQGPRGTLAGTDGGGSAVEPPHLAPQLGGTSPPQLILEINGSGHQSYSLK